MVCDACRPKWERCAPIVEGGVERWNELSCGKTSNELVDILLNEIIGGNDPVSETVTFVIEPSVSSSTTMWWNSLDLDLIQEFPPFFERHRMCAIDTLCNEMFPF